MQNNTNTPSNNNINDFGQKIGGARKDLYAEAREWAATVAAIDADKLAAAGLSKLVKRPNLERMATTGAITRSNAAAAWTIWRTIGRAPSWCSMTWATRTAAVLSKIADIVTTNPDTIPDEITARADYRVIMATEWPAVPFSFGKYQISQYESGTLRICDGHYLLGNGSTDPADIAARLSQMVEADNAKAAAKRANGPRLSVYRNRAGLYFVAPDDKAEIVIKTFETYEAAREYITNNRAEALEKYAALRTFPALRRDWNRPRVGQDWRGGVDTTPETFAAALPFRGVEFGNWVNQTERAALLNSAFDGFHDLANVLNIAPAAVTLSGSLAFAFGARGHSNAAAHYEPEKVVINLTKKNGAGCMAHEWFHAVDNYAAGGGLDNYATEGSANPAAAAILQAIKKMDYYRRSKNLANFKGDYWTSGRELTARAFEGVIMALLPYNGIVSDFLANVTSFDEFTAQDVAHRSEFYPYPTADEAAALLPLYLDFLRSVFGEGVNVNPAAIADSERARQKAEAERIEAERIREERRRAEEEEAARRRAEKEAERERKAAEMKANAESSRAALVDVLTAAHFDQIATGFDSSSVYAVAHMAGELWTIAADIKTTNEKGRDYIAAQPMARINYKYCHNAKRIIARRWQRNEIKSSCRTASEFVREMLTDDPAEVRSIADNFSSTARPDTWQEAARLYEDTQCSRAELMNRHATPKPTEQKTDTNEAPAEGLELVKIADGVAVVGDSRTTYRNRKEIKAHGATWNKAAQQWQATTPEAVAAIRAWFGQDANTPASEKTKDTPANQKSPAPYIATADTNDPAAMKEAAENVRDWCITDQLADPTPYAAALDDLAAIAWAVLTNYTPTEAAAMVAAALQIAGDMKRHADTITEGAAAMEEANRNEYDPDQWEANREEIEQFKNYAEELAIYSEGLAAAVGVPDWQLCDVAAIPEPQDDPAQLAMAMDILEAPAPTPDVLQTLPAKNYKLNEKYNAHIEKMREEYGSQDTKEKAEERLNEQATDAPAILYGLLKCRPDATIQMAHDLLERENYHTLCWHPEVIEDIIHRMLAPLSQKTTEAAPVTDAEVYERAARIRANYEAIKAEAEQPAANLPEWAKEFAPVTYTHHGRTLTGYIMNIHKAFRGNRYICTFNEEGTLFTTFVEVSDCTPLLEAA